MKYQSDCVSMTLNKYLEQYQGKVDAVEYVFNEDGMKTGVRR